MGVFHYKQFDIRQDNAAMKIGTDGTLLGAWTNASDAKHILDIGTGTGVIALMLAQRNPTAHITGIEICEHAIIDAEFNVNASPWSERVTIVNKSLQSFTPSQKFDLIVSNPPFFENSLKSPSGKRSKARHTDSLSYLDIIQFVAQHLTEDGRLSMILPVENAQKCIEKAKELGLHLERECLVRPTPTKRPHRIVFELSKKALPPLKETLTIETGKRHDYSAEYIALTKEFYTIM